MAMEFVIIPVTCVFMQTQTGMVFAIPAAKILSMRTAMVSVIIMEPAKEADMAAAAMVGVETASVVDGADKRNNHAERTGNNQSHRAVFRHHSTALYGTFEE